MRQLCFSLAFLLMFSHCAWAVEQSKPTRVVQFKAIEAKPVKEGHCWTESLAIPGKRAWRCMVGNVIYDPCFTTASAQIVICNVNPAENKTGFALKLIKPLPEPTLSKTTGNQFFQMRLVDGSICAPFTGTRPSLGKEMVIYGCTGQRCPTLESCQIGVLSVDRRKSQWVAKVVVYRILNNGKIEVKALEEVPVDTAWE